MAFSNFINFGLNKYFKLIYYISNNKIIEEIIANIFTANLYVLSFKYLIKKFPKIIPKIKINIKFKSVGKKKIFEKLKLQKYIEM